MRATIIALPLLIIASPLRAQMAPGPPPAVIPPAAADRVADTLDAVTDAVLDLRVGRLKAAIDGRAPSPAERRMTVRDLERRDDPGFDRKLHRQIAQARPVVRESIRAANDAIPQLIAGLQQISRAVERATANLPDPTYPNR
jgi:hypothetical protein